MSTKLKLPPVRKDLHEIERSVQPSETVLIRIAGHTGITLGRYIHGAQFWQADNWTGEVVVAEWWPLPKTNTGTLIELPNKNKLIDIYHEQTKGEGWLQEERNLVDFALMLKDESTDARDGNEFHCYVEYNAELNNFSGNFGYWTEGQGLPVESVFVMFNSLKELGKIDFEESFAKTPFNKDAFFKLKIKLLLIAELLKNNKD